MRNLILLQENSGNVSFLKDIPDPNLRDLVRIFIDGLAENFESIKTSLQMFGFYDRIINLTDFKCTKANLLEEMISETKDGNLFDLLILGHGSKKKIYLHGSETMTDKDIENLLTEARKLHPGMKFNLRLVYMCNCFSGTLLDSWLKIGAKTALGCNDINYMPEPQTTYFFDDFVKKGFSASDANNRSFSASNTMWAVAGLSKNNREGSKLAMKGENIKFDGRRLAVGETIERNIYAGNSHNNTSIYLIAGEKYEFKVAATEKWRNGFKETNANGYAKSLFDKPRQTDYNMMTLVGEIFNDNGNVMSYAGTHFKIGTSRTWTVSRSGFLVCHANDGIAFYGDNSGKVCLKIKRIA